MVLLVLSSGVHAMKDDDWDDWELGDKDAKTLNQYQTQQKVPKVSEENTRAIVSTSTIATQTDNMQDSGVAEQERFLASFRSLLGILCLFDLTNESSDGRKE